LRGSETSIVAWIAHKGYSEAPKDKQALFIMFSETRFLRRIIAVAKPKSSRSK
jgi:hypothetical protein